MVTFGLFSVISSVCTVPILLPLEGLIWAVTTGVTDASRGNWLEFWANPSGSLPKFSLAALFPCQMIMYSVKQRTRIENGSSLDLTISFLLLMRYTVSPWQIQHSYSMWQVPPAVLWICNYFFLKSGSRYSLKSQGSRCIRKKTDENCMVFCEILYQCCIQYTSYTVKWSWNFANKWFY